MLGFGRAIVDRARQVFEGGLGLNLITLKPSSPIAEGNRWTEVCSRIPLGLSEKSPFLRFPVVEREVIEVVAIARFMSPVLRATTSAIGTYVTAVLLYASPPIGLTLGWMTGNDLSIFIYYLGPPLRSRQK